MTLPKTLVPLLVWTAACASVSNRHDPTAALVAAERAFAADAQTRSPTEAFASAFSYDGVMFRPGPVNAIELMKKQPFPPNMMLNWAPIYAETSSNERIGATLGVYEVGERGQPPAETGHFVSIWHREGDVWRVMADAGVAGPIEKPVAQAGELLRTRSTSNRFRVDEMLYAIDDSLSSAHNQRLAIHGAADLRLLRAGHAPTRTLDEALRLAAANPVSGWQRGKLHVPLSGDFAYTYGTATVDAKPAGWIRVYRKTNMSRWQLIMEIVQPS